MLGPTSIVGYQGLGSDLDIGSLFDIVRVQASVGVKLGLDTWSQFKCRVSNQMLRVSSKVESQCRIWDRSFGVLVRIGVEVINPFKSQVPSSDIRVVF